ncbi:hypothetical protein CHS0354_042946 [Potamilus streckersoni]|uniref:CDT1 Geminin-binding domain-containing protein n=1 Tax=Potamilus streckersoni TaxID=2493646 RepID=A0AAE0T5W3_9BIVA|nr:hypothetical protein CHS0354_042946 [Potamilus streckersoni]
MEAQGRVTDFFASKKHNSDTQPSKRRKVQLIPSETNISYLDLTNKYGNRKGTVAGTIPKTGPTKPENDHSVQISSTKAVTSKTNQIMKTLRSTRKKKCRKLNQKGQMTIDNIFERIAKESSGLENGQEQGVIVDETTSFWDDHDGPISSGNQTPVRSIQTAAGQSVPSRKRRRDAETKLVEGMGVATPEKNYRPTIYPETSKSRRKIDLVETLEKKTEEELDFILPKTPPAISPLHKTPEKIQALDIKPAPDSCRNLFQKMESMTDKLSPDEVKADLSADTEVKVKFSAAEVKAKLSTAEVKARLAKAKKLEQLKEQLIQFNKDKAELEKSRGPRLKKFEEIKIELDTDKSSAVPAYEKYHSLAAPTPPSLTLPYKYKVLAEMFQSMDTVVSMLHNRTEICTFSKLKAAVQEMTRRNFEQKNVGQIKTVYPTAYHLRQEKGLPMFGKKTTGYELTIEPDFSDSADAVNVKTEPNTRALFTAKHLLQRKDIFQRSLIRRVKQYHREFLSKLEKPLTIPDDKITRWHPRFQLDQVPDVVSAPLPEAPVELKYQTAKDVLECRRGQLLPKVVEKALEEVCKESEISQPVKIEPQMSVQNLAATKGIPQSLLEKIRAKEAKKLEMSLTRDFKEDKKIERMKRLPGIMRIIRTHFVTEKKPALPLEPVIQKLVDSFHSCISYHDVEAHVKLIVEILPEWMTMVEIKRGKFLKIDKNLDLQTVVDKVENMIKTCI